MTQTIVPHLWFNTQAKEAAELYTSVFPDSRVISVTSITDTPSGDTDIVSFDLFGQRFQAISAGPLFDFTPAISFFVQCDTTDELDRYYNVLSEGGAVMVPMGDYGFSKKYVWFADRYGLSWQLALKGDEPIRQRLTPMLMFVGEQCGRAEEAVKFYTSIFPDTDIHHIMHYEQDMPPNKAGTVQHAEFTLSGQQFAAMDSGEAHHFTFNEAISLMVYCDTQAEIDHYWDKMSAVPEAEQCGWLKDQFGMSWQIVPRAMDDMLESSDPERVARVTEAFLQMKKFDLAELQRAYEGG